MDPPEPPLSEPIAHHANSIDSPSDTDTSRQLPREVMHRVLQLLTPNELALNGRLTCRDASLHFADPPFSTLHLDQPLPPDVLTCPHVLGRAAECARLLPFWSRLQLLSTAAASGCTTNLTLAWQLLQPALIPELLSSGHYLRLTWRQLLPDPGTAAARAGHAHLLPWLVARCRELLSPSSALAAVAQQCDLAALQEAWQLLKQVDPSLALGGLAVDAAAESRTPDTAAKLGWLLAQLQQQQQHSGPNSLHVHAALAAARCGNVQRLRELGDAVRSERVLWATLRHADSVDVATWLVDVGGCPLPDPQADVLTCRQLAAAAASAKHESVVKLRWLAGRGVLAVDAESLLVDAAAGGQLDAVRFLYDIQPEDGKRAALSGAVFVAAVRSGSVRMAEWMVRQNGGSCLADAVAYHAAAEMGDVGMLRWLAVDAGCPRGVLTVQDVIFRWPVAGGAKGRGGLLQAVRVLLDAGFPQGPSPVSLAAERGDLELVRLLHEEYGLELQADVLVWAAKGGCEALVEWGLERVVGAGREGQVQWERVWCAAAKHGDLGTMECLRRLGVPWGQGLLRRAVVEHLPLAAVRWMVGQGAPADRAEATAAVAAAGVHWGTPVAVMQYLGDLAMGAASQ